MKKKSDSIAGRIIKEVLRMLLVCVLLAVLPFLMLQGALAVMAGNLEGLFLCSLPFLIVGGLLWYYMVKG